MDNRDKERHEEERLLREEHHHSHHEKDVTSDVVADSLRAEAKNKKRRSTKRINNLWLWLGVLVLVLIILWWLFTFGTAEDLSNGLNG